MKDLRIITVAVLLLLSRTALVYAQGAGIEWEILNKESLYLQRQGKYNRAAVVAKKALEVAEQNVGPDHPDVATSLYNLAGIYEAQGNTPKPRRSTSAGSRSMQCTLSSWPRSTG